ncbi:MAG: LacI family transcriptional regulator [Lachnospiraceae bacterium]|nr:LacI family transcriptional regulator [Lachnospiraceae bacterium]
MRKEVRLADIAERLNVSTVTVSNALANQKGVSDELREKIKQTAAEMGYQSRSAAGVTVREILNLGVIISEKYLGDYPSFYWKVYQELTIAAREKNCVLLFEMLTHEAERTKTLPLFAHNSKIEGILVIGEIGSAYLETLLEGTSLPQIYVDFMKKEFPVSCVMTNNFYGMYQIVSHLIELGHRDIAYVGTVQANTSIMDRYFGYCKALMEAGMAINPDWVLDDRTLEGKMMEIKLPKKMPTAFACNSDLTASEVVKTLKNKGFRIPEDISVTGFDNYLYEGLCDISITTYEVNIKEMVKTALDLVLSQIQPENGNPQEMAIISGRLVEKESAGGADGLNIKNNSCERV